MKKKVTFYEILVYLAYGFYLLLGLAWLIIYMANRHQLNPWALVIVVVFSSQVYYKHRLTNLILGIITLFFSIWMLMELLNSPDPASKQVTYDAFTKGLMGFCVFSVVMSGILMFSFSKLAHKDQLH